MSERPTPETDAFFRTFADGEAAPSHAEYYDRMAKLERERDAERALAERRGRLYDTAIRQLKKLQAQVDELNDKIRYNEVESSHNWRNRERDREAISAWKEARSE